GKTERCKRDLESRVCSLRSTKNEEAKRITPRELASSSLAGTCRQKRRRHSGGNASGNDVSSGCACRSVEVDDREKRLSGYMPSDIARLHPAASSRHGISQQARCVPDGNAARQCLGYLPVRL